MSFDLTLLCAYSCWALCNCPARLPQHCLLGARALCIPPCMPAVRLGFEIGYELDGKFYINNHLMLLVLVRLLLGSSHMGRPVGMRAEKAACLSDATTLQDLLLWRWPSSHQVVCTCAACR